MLLRKTNYCVNQICYIKSHVSAAVSLEEGDFWSREE